MAEKTNNEPQPLASWWSAPTYVAGTEMGAGQPLTCIATTYTFDAKFFERDLLPRFLGLRFDDTESERPFVIERERALGTTRVSILVDGGHIQPTQTTLGWDQLRVRTRGGIQHAKITLLVWERLVRLIVGSANLTIYGYRQNREIACVADFFNDPSSPPRQLALDAIAFLEAITDWVSAAEQPITRLRESLAATRNRIRRWSDMHIDFRPQEYPKAFFVGGLPGREGRLPRLPIKQATEIWGDRRADGITVMTPFVGDPDGPFSRLISELLRIPRRREAKGYLVVPGKPSERDAHTMMVNLPRAFLDAWATAWRIGPAEVPTYVVPLRRGDDAIARDFHAKGVLVFDEKMSMLLCGSSNFTLHGMGVGGAANIEANLCYLDYRDEKRGGVRLEDRLPVNWQIDETHDAIWPDAVTPLDEDLPPTTPNLPDIFLWATYNQREAELVVGLDPGRSFPAEWSVRLPGDALTEAALAGHRECPKMPDDGRITCRLPDSLKSANITCLLVNWLEPGSGRFTALLPVQVREVGDLLPPDELRSLSIDAIIEHLISGRDLAEQVDGGPPKPPGHPETPDAAADSLRAVDTSGYVLYRVRRLGRALAMLGERILRTVRTREAMTYRLRHDSVGPSQLVDALVREWVPNDGVGRGAGESSAVVFAVVEVALTVAHVGRRVHAQREAGDPDLRPLFRELAFELLGRAGVIDGIREDRGGLIQEYVIAVQLECERLVGKAEMGGSNAS